MDWPAARKWKSWFFSLISIPLRKFQVLFDLCICVSHRVYTLFHRNSMNLISAICIGFFVGWNRFAQFYTTSVSQFGLPAARFFVCRFKYSTKRSGNDSNQNENVGNVNEISQYKSVWLTAHSVATATSTITTIIDFFCAICYHSKFQYMHENREQKKTTKLNKAMQSNLYQFRMQGHISREQFILFIMIFSPQTNLNCR